MRRLPLAVVGALALALAACGDDGGGGDQDAFCEEFEALVEQIEDGDLSSGNGLADIGDTLGNMFEAANDDQADALESLADVPDADPDDAEETFEQIEDELEDFADDCDLELTAPEITTTTGTTATTGTTGTTGTTAPPPPSSGGEVITVTARVPVPPEVVDQALGAACFDGNFQACDDLFNTAQSEADATYADSCGGRIPNGTGQFCTDVFFAGLTPPPDALDPATTGACSAGDMLACDNLLQTGEPDNTFGFFCGGRINVAIADTTTFCVDIFGEQAFE